MHLNLSLDFLPREGTAQDKALLAALFEAHRTAASDNPNLSKQVCVGAYQASESFVQAVAAGLLTLGQRHGPIRAARLYLRTFDLADLRQRLLAGKIVPGLGNSFFKHSIDPAFLPVLAQLEENYPEIHAKLQQTAAVAMEIKRIHLNAALLTAACCEVLKVPEGVEHILFMLPRLPVWAAECGKIERTGD